MAVRGNDSSGSIGAAIASAIGIVSAIIVLPSTIAEHLFPKDEESHLIKIVENMQKHDLVIKEQSEKQKENTAE